MKTVQEIQLELLAKGYSKSLVFSDLIENILVNTVAAVTPPPLRKAVFGDPIAKKKECKKRCQKYKGKFQQFQNCMKKCI